MQKPSVGRIVHFVPPQDCKGKTTLDFYAAVITQVKEVKAEPGNNLASDIYMCDLATLGPNSLYFQHEVPEAEVYAPGHWTWPPKV